VSHAKARVGEKGLARSMRRARGRLPDHPINFIVP
jgi:hypothetical protein